MDQFRGYTVVGMFLVNFVGSYEIMKDETYYLPQGGGFLESVYSSLCHFAAILRPRIPHGDGFFAYADSIMPSFIFCAGFSYRLTALRRFSQSGAGGVAWGYIRRSFALIGISLVVFGLGKSFSNWDDMTADSVSNWLWELIKADVWEVLSIIGVSQILLLPVINRSFRIRLIAAFGLLAFYILINYSFDYNFQAGLENWMNKFFGADGRRSWDGGFFGPIAWAIPMLAGTLVYDILASWTPKKAMFLFLVVGTVLMAAGYGVSCLTRLYDRVEGNTTAVTGDDAKGHATDPVWPRAERWTNPGIGWAEPPFFANPPVEERELNFWMMYKRIVAPAFILFSIGFALFLYSLFIAASDIGSFQAGLFKTFGQNPLAAYIIHEITMLCFKSITPKDCEWWWLAIMFSVFFAVTWGAVKYMENNKLYLRL